MLSNFLKLVLGFILAIAILAGSGVAIALYFMNRTSIPPAKPIYANDNPALKAQNSKATEVEDSPTSTSETSPNATPSASPTESPEALPQGAYRGRVTWAEGLSLRSEPNPDAQRIGGVAFKTKIIVLEENENKTWQKIRVEGSKEEGWIKIGNVEREDQ